MWRKAFTYFSKIAFANPSTDQLLQHFSNRSPLSFKGLRRWLFWWFHTADIHNDMQKKENDFNELLQYYRNDLNNERGL